MNTLIEIDALGKPCPLPLLLLKKQLKLQSQKGTSHAQHYLLKSSDPNSELDITRYCQIHQLKCDFKKISEQEFHYLIES